MRLEEAREKAHRSMPEEQWNLLPSNSNFEVQPLTREERDMLEYSLRNLDHPDVFFNQDYLQELCKYHYFETLHSNAEIYSERLRFEKLLLEKCLFKNWFHISPEDRARIVSTWQLSSKTRDRLHEIEELEQQAAENPEEQYLNAMADIDRGLQEESENSLLKENHVYSFCEKEISQMIEDGLRSRFTFTKPKWAHISSDSSLWAPQESEPSLSNEAQNCLWLIRTDQNYQAHDFLAQ
jgi:hypothetical protein